jgi:hypothetical protein
MSTYFQRVGGMVLLALVIGCLSALPAQATQIGEAGGSKSWSGTRHIGVYEKPCKLKYKKKPAKRKQCNGAGKMRMHVSKAHRASARQIARNGDLVSPSGVTLREAAERGGAGSIRWKTFWQSGITIPGVESLYDERHEGMAFYNGEDVWIKADHGSDDGYHRCGIETQMPGFSVNNTDCSENSKYMPSGTEYIQFWDYFEIAPVCKWCFPTHYDMHVNIHENGYVSFWWFDDKRDVNN